MISINEINFHDLDYLKQRIYFEKSRAERKYYYSFSIVLINLTEFYNRIRKRKQSVEILKRIIVKICNILREIDTISIDEHEQKLIILLSDTTTEKAEYILQRLKNQLLAEQTLKQYTSIIFNDNHIKIFTYPFDNYNNKQNQEFDLEERVGSIELVSMNTNYMFLKRIIDIAGAIVGLIISAPLMFLIAILIKLTSRGPIFFKQERVGYRGKRFMMLKFRSMYMNSSQQTHRNYIQKLLTCSPQVNRVQEYREQIDKRITPIGNFIRKTSIDELPQLINVLRGDMTLVGPRPHPPYEVALYKDWYFRRLLVKPGLTGLSKIYLRCTPENYEEAMRYDVRYVGRRSLKQDLKIILQTIPSLLLQNGAY